MDEIKNQLYKFFLSREKDFTIAWSGGPFSSLLWFIAYTHLNLRPKVVFIDDGKLPVSLYSFIESTRRKYNLDFQMIQCEPGKIMETLKALPGEVITGKRRDFGVCPTENLTETWNFLKTISTPYYAEKKGALG
jgi:3'-phosphoadenosine 5'-phosphosulfate sulfotransferase (PAPS reductase)/FAD synthetase